MGFDRIKSRGGRGKGNLLSNMRGRFRRNRDPHLYADHDVDLPVSSATTITDTGVQTFTVPYGVDTINITMYGAGGGGGDHNSGRGADDNGGGGGGGARLVLTLEEIAPGTILTFNNGAGGAHSLNTTAYGSAGGNTTLSFDGIDYVAGGGEGSAGGGIFGGGSQASNGTGGVADCDSGANCTATNGNDGTPKLSTGAAGAALGDSAGAGGAGGTSSTPDAVDGGDGKIIIS